MLLVTTSWDDGDALDARLAALLEKYDLTGTFYITRDYRGNRLSDDAIRDLALRHEVGAHSLTHPDLRTLSLEEKRREIAGSKQWLEDVAGREAPLFCYPAGHFDADDERIVRESGFLGARTTRLADVDLPANPYQMPTTLAVYPMPFRKIGPHAYYWGKLLQPFQERAPGLRKLGVPLTAFRSWETTAHAAFDIALSRGEVFHLWGHSWEIDRYQMWEELERVLAYMRAHTGAYRAVANSALVSAV
ncbi:polysaccharide deacetylase family protein [Patescibacteria group bacterium]|nr:polysaccharide deacetylase family protein [Patescibacteria group bacterium]